MVKKSKKGFLDRDYGKKFEAVLLEDDDDDPTEEEGTNGIKTFKIKQAVEMIKVKS